MTRIALTCCLAIAAFAAVPALAAAAPGTTTGRATNVTSTGATLNGSVNPHGSPTSYYFRYGTTKSYGSRTPTGDAGAGGTAVTVSAALAGLKPLTTYHYQLLAFSPAGATTGADRTFKTPQIPTTSSIAVGPNPSVFGGLVTVSGFLTGPDVANKQVALESNAFPYTGGFHQIGNTVLTTSLGGYTFLITPTINSQLRVVDLSKPSVTSPVVQQNIMLRPTLKARKSHHVFGRVKFSGQVFPAHPGDAAVIQQDTRKGWKNVGLTLTKAKTTAFSGFARNVRLHKGADFRVLVRSGTGDFVDGTSRTVRVHLR